MVPEWLDYGRFNGLGQWHNSGKGTFTWELIETKQYYCNGNVKYRYGKAEQSNVL